MITFLHSCTLVVSAASPGLAVPRSALPPTGDTRTIHQRHELKRPGRFLPAEHPALKVPHADRRELHLEELPLAGRDGATGGLDREHRGGTDGLQRRAPGGRGLLPSTARLAQTMARLGVRRGTRGGGEETPCGKEEVRAGRLPRRRFPAPLPPAEGGQKGAGMRLAECFQQEGPQGKNRESGQFARGSLLPLAKS